MKITDFKALAFDCYGTLVDKQSGIFDGMKVLTSRLPGYVTRNVLVEAHARIEHAQQQLTPTKNYREILAIVCKRLSEEWGHSASWGDCVAYGRSVEDWPLFTDTAGALQYFKRHYKLLLFDNADNESLAATIKRMETEFDATYTAEDCGSYKPSASNFEYMLANLAALGVQKEELLLVSANARCDLEPAKRHGLASCRIARLHAQNLKKEQHPTTDFCFVSLADFVRAHQDALRG